ncbi:MAG: methionine gamma-lyase family protein [Lachnospiraceae bacterium]|nr:methionine gamma-lyase family protein [Lachnospiraceae bacterium]
MMDQALFYENAGISRETYDFCKEVLAQIEDRFKEIDAVSEVNQLKVMEAFRKAKVSEYHFDRSTGYGYNDNGRDTLEKVYSYVFNTEDALVRPQIASGTHAISTALFAVLRPGDEMLSIAGKPYDTLDEDIGIRECSGSLKEFGVTYAQADLTADGRFDLDAIGKKINEKTKLIHIQRSRGYDIRPSLSVDEIARAIKYVKSVKKDVIVFVDNCYGEFADVTEPTDHGADLMAGSLIKNPGGGLAESGGYIVGRHDLIELCGYRLIAPGIGREVGANMGVLRSFYQGLFLSPSVVASSMKCALFAAAVYEKLGYKVSPASDEKRNDIIQVISFGNPEDMLKFSRGIQSSSPVDSYVVPEADDMPGYDSKVVMAAGTFVSGSSIELSCDGPLRAPYLIFMQGGLTWQHCKYAIMKTVQEMKN